MNESKSDWPLVVSFVAICALVGVACVVERSAGPAVLFVVVTGVILFFRSI